MKAIDRYIEDQKRSIKYRKSFDILSNKSFIKKSKERSLKISSGNDND
jgi:hypothetical protein